MIGLGHCPGGKAMVPGCHPAPLVGPEALHKHGVGPAGPGDDLGAMKLLAGGPRGVEAVDDGTLRQPKEVDEDDPARWKLSVACKNCDSCALESAVGAFSQPCPEVQSRQAKVPIDMIRFLTALSSSRLS